MRYALSQLSDAALLHGLTTLVARDRVTTAEVLAHIAEVDERRLYLAAGYPSMHAYCVEELHLSEDPAFKRIRAARAARRIPALFDAIAGGELNLAAVNLLAPHLTQANAEELIAAAMHKRNVEIEALLAARFPRSEFLALAEVSPAGNAPIQLAARRVDAANSLPAKRSNSRSEAPRLTPVSAERYLLHVPIDRATHDKLQHAATLLSHAVPAGDEAERVFGSGFMHARRVAARARIAETRRRATEARTPPRSPEDSALASGRRDVSAALRTLGFHAAESAGGLACSEFIPGASLEAQVKAALRALAPRSRAANSHPRDDQVRSRTHGRRAFSDRG